MAPRRWKRRAKVKRAPKRGPTGFSAGVGWDATTGTGTPIDPDLVDYLLTYVSPGDGTAAIANTQPKSHPKPIVPGSMRPH